MQMAPALSCFHMASLSVPFTCLSPPLHQAHDTAWLNVHMCPGVEATKGGIWLPPVDGYRHPYCPTRISHTL